MAWVAFDRGDQGRARRSDSTCPLEHWRELRERIHAQICERGFDAKRNCFVQAYGSQQLDASLLLMPELGFLPPDDPRVLGTIRAIETRLLRDGFVLRYDTDETEDGLPPGEGAFLACSFWLANAYAMTGRHDEAVRAVRAAACAVATTSGCSPRNTTPPPSGCSAISRRASRTCP